MKYIHLALVLLISDISFSQFAFLYSSAGSEYGKACTVDKDTNYIEAALFANTINVNPYGTTNLTTTGGIDVVFAKYNKSGNLIFGKRFGGNTTTDAPHGVTTDASGNIYITGYFGSTADANPHTANFNPNGGGTISTKSNFDAYLAKYDKNGNYLWAFGLGNTAGNTEERGWDLISDSEGNVYVCGAMKGSIDFNPLGTANIKSVIGSDVGLFLAKYNSSGINQWVMVVSANDTSVFYEAYTAVDLDNGFVYLAGNFRGSNVNFNPNGISTLSSSGETDMFLAKYSTAGNFIWAKRIGGASTDIISPGAMRLDKNKMPFFTGRISGTVNFNTSGGTNNVSGASLFLSTYDTAGVLRYAFGMQSNAGDGGHRIAFDSQNDVYVAGWMNGTVNFNPNGTFNVTAVAPTADAFVAKYTSTGNFIWVNHFGAINSTENNITAGLAVDQMNKVYITGQLFGTGADFDPSLSGNLILSSAGLNDCFLAKYNSTDGSLWTSTSVRIIPNIIPEKYSLEQNYPNPFNPTTKIRFSIPMRSPIENHRSGSSTFGDDGVVLNVYDILGKEVAVLMNEILPNGIYEVNWNAINFSSGLYFYKLTVGNPDEAQQVFSDTKCMVLVK
jgi:hypothetical protein